MGPMYIETLYPYQPTDIDRKGDRKKQNEINRYNACSYLSISIKDIIIFTQHLRSGRIWHKVNF